ncbi:pectinesterase-like [Coffea arabica]|uniref:Pectinesterase n=1 Tax=Coffea arabica TaxID=13443 RepID=A0A6P6WFG8_COFAR
MAKGASPVIVIVLVTVVSVYISIHFQLQGHKKLSNVHGNGIMFNATVSKTRHGAYRRIMDAIASLPIQSQSRYFIHVEADIYVEIVEVWANKTNIALIGDGANVTKITINRRVPEFQTNETATLSVKGDRFMAKYITFENSAGEGTQAVALMSLSDGSSFYRCTFLGFHDTLCAHFGRQFYKECDIYGTVDFVFGNAAAVFQTCNLYARLPNRVITFTAQGKKSRYERSGFVIQNSTLTAAPDLQSNKSQVHAFLGRPWFAWSTVIVMQSFLDSIIDPAGWYEWPGHRTDELTYREYGNWGPGAGTGRRISWAGYKALNQSKEVIPFTVSKFIQGDSWIPESGIPYTSGLY